jgi:hypothetical protein
VRDSDPTVRRLVKLVGVGGVALVVGAALIWLVTPDAWPLLLVGALLLLGAPFYVAATAGGVVRKPSRRGDTHTFVVDLFRSVDHPPTIPGARPESDEPPRSAVPRQASLDPEPGQDNPRLDA